MRRLNRFKKESGQGLTEYIILIVFIALVAIAAVSIFGKEIRAWFGEATEELSGESASIQHATAGEIQSAVNQDQTALK